MDQGWILNPGVADPEFGNLSLNPGRAWGIHKFGNSQFQPGGILADPKSRSADIPGIQHSRCLIREFHVPGTHPSGNPGADGWERPRFWDSGFPSFPRTCG